MNAIDYMERGREAYRRGRVIIAGTIARKFWQRAAFIDGYRAERAAWLAANPGADELGEAARRNSDWCRSMIVGGDA